MKCFCSFELIWAKLLPIDENVQVSDTRGDDIKSKSRFNNK